MVTKAKEVPWNEVEDLMEDLRQWLVRYAGVPEREELPAAADPTTPALEPRRLEPLEIAMITPEIRADYDRYSAGGFA